MSNQDCPEPHPIMTSFTVSDVKRSIVFYRDKLGFRMRECWPNEQQPMFASLLLDKQCVMFGQAMPAAAVEKLHEKNPKAAKFWSEQATAQATGRRGLGVNTYICVADVDAYAGQIKQRGVAATLPPTTQFYGLRDLVVVDPDGYMLTFYTPVAMGECQSCGMPLTDSKPGQMYCQYCVDEKGALRPYEQVFEGTVNGYFMAHMKMARKDAEKAAKEHLAKMPAWVARK